MSTYREYDSARTLAAFAADPIGWTVVLEDGSEAEVLDVLEGEYGRYLKLRGHRDWLHVSRVTGVVVYSVAINPAYSAPIPSSSRRTDSRA